MEKSLRTFCKKMIIFVIIFAIYQLVVTFSCRKYPMHVYDTDYATYVQQRDYVSKNNDYNRVIFIGDSLAKAAYYPPKLSDDSYNLALSGISPIEMYYNLKAYFEGNEPPKYIFISFSPYHFLACDRLWERSIYFHYYSDDILNDIFKEASDYKNSEDILIRNKNWEMLQYKIYSFTKYSKAVIGSLLDDRFERNKKIYDTVSIKRGQNYIGTLQYSDEISTEADYREFKAKDILDGYLRKIIDLCIQNNIEVIIEMPPMNDASYYACTEVYLQGVLDYLAEIQKDYPDITVNTNREHWDNSYFGDSMHLNERGVERYTDYLLEKYNNIFG